MAAMFEERSAEAARARAAAGRARRRRRGHGGELERHGAPVRVSSARYTSHAAGANPGARRDNKPSRPTGLRARRVRPSGSWTLVEPVPERHAEVVERPADGADADELPIASRLDQAGVAQHLQVV